MFSRKEQLIQRTGKSGVGRFSFLKLLVEEFRSSKSREAKEQVLANLANFAYDPVNYDYLRSLRVTDLFLEVLSEQNKTFVRFAIGGICNLCSDPLNREYVLRKQGIPLVTSLLSSSDEETVLSAITTLIFLITPESKKEIVSPEIINCMVSFSKVKNARLRNLSSIFLTDYCDSKEIEKIQNIPQVTSNTVHTPNE